MHNKLNKLGAMNDDFCIIVDLSKPPAVNQEKFRVKS